MIRRLAGVKSDEVRWVLIFIFGARLIRSSHHQLCRVCFSVGECMLSAARFARLHFTRRIRYLRGAGIVAGW